MLKEVCALNDLRLKDFRSLMILIFVYEHPGSTISEVAKGVGISYKTAQRYLREFRQPGKLVAKFEDSCKLRFYLNCPAKVDAILLSFKETIKSMLEWEE